MSHSLTIEFDDALLLSSGMTAEQFEREARLLLAVKLYEMGRLASGRAAAWCGMSRAAFLTMLPQLGVPASNLRPQDADADVTFAHG